MSNKDLEPPCGNPYTILGLTYGVKDADISKAYKKYALLYHPDKQKKALSPKEKEVISKKFHDLTEAKSFLLDSEHTEKRKKYDLFLKSKLHRKKEDEERDRSMNAKRKKLREELLKKEQEAKRPKSTIIPTTKQSTKDKISNLQKQGKRLREEYTYEQEKQNNIQEKISKQNLKEKLQQRQIKLKWNSKSVIDPLDRKISITNLLKDFGTISNVDLKKDKYNIALVTFENVSSCKDCVEHFLHDDCIRASYIGKQKYARHSSDRKALNTNDKESLQERDSRQAAEREALIRQMEEEEDGDVFSAKHSDIGVSSFPIQMPMDIGCTNPLVQLERYEMLYIPKEYRIK